MFSTTAQLIQKPHLLVQNPLQPLRLPLHSCVDGRPALLLHAQLLGFLECFTQVLKVAVHDVVLLGEGFGEFGLVVVEEGAVGDDDGGDGSAEGV